MSHQILIFTACLVLALPAAEWNQFGGAQGNFISTETGLLKEWPATGPKLLWHSSEVGIGWSGIATGQGRILTCGLIPVGDRRQPAVICLDADGSLQWQRKLPIQQTWGGTGPTPCLHAGKVYLPLQGKREREHKGPARTAVICLDASTGKTIWQTELSFGPLGNTSLASYGGYPGAGSVTVANNTVYMYIGQRGADLVALDAQTGELVWKTGGVNGGMSNCTPVVVRHKERRLIIHNAGLRLAIFDADQGDLLCQRLWVVRAGNRNDTCSNPTFADGHIWVGNGYRKTCDGDRALQDGGLLYRLTAATDDLKLHWNGSAIASGYAGAIAHEGRLFGSGKAGFSCLDIASGKVLASRSSSSLGRPKAAWTLAYADGCLYLAGCHSGGSRTFVLLSADAKLTLRGQFSLSPKQLGDPTTTSAKGKTKAIWRCSYPAIANKRLYLRCLHRLFVYDIAE